MLNERGVALGMSFLLLISELLLERGGFLPQLRRKTEKFGERAAGG